MLLSTSNRTVHEMSLLDYNACNAKFCTAHKFHSAFNPKKKKYGLYFFVKDLNTILTGELVLQFLSWQVFNPSIVSNNI